MDRKAEPKGVIAPLCKVCQERHWLTQPHSWDKNTSRSDGTESHSLQTREQMLHSIAAPEKRVKAKAVLAKAEVKAKPLAKPKPKAKTKRGRPARPDEPWKAEGLSRSAWYRKQKAKVE